MADSGVSAGTDYGARAEVLLERALSEVRDGIDAIPSVTEALEWLRAEAGESDPPEQDHDELECICSPELLARGGFKGGCPAHG